PVGQRADDTRSNARREPMSRNGLLELRARATVGLFIVFADLTHYSLECMGRDDAEVAQVMDGFYERVSRSIRESRGTVVKFMGDAALAVYEEADVDAGANALLELEREVDAYFADLGWKCRLVVKGHFGSVVAGPYGPPEDRRF